VIATTAPATLLVALVPSDVGSVAVVGEGVHSMADAAVRDRALAPLVEHPRWAVLASGGSAVAAERLSDLPDGLLDAVVLRRAWSDRSEAKRLLTIAGRILRPGGALVAADLDVDALLDGPAVRYPIGALWRRDGAPAAALRSSTLSPTVLSTDVSAARFRDAFLASIDEVRGEYASDRALWAALREHGWRGDTWMAPGRRAEFFDALEALPSGSVPVVDREPWVAVTGVRP
jgi:SAM-dependent methyltransferase